MYEFRWIRDHVEVYDHGEFLFSADTKEEAVRELAQIQEEEEPHMNSNTKERRGRRVEVGPVDDAAQVEPMAKTATGVVTNCLKVNLRKEASRDAAVLEELPALTELTVELDETLSEFYRVRTAKGVQGYCMKPYIALRR